MEPLTYISDDLVPYFDPKLKDEVKSFGEHWHKVLPKMVDPANKFVYIRRVEIQPNRARKFLIDTRSSHW